MYRIVHTASGRKLPMVLWPTDDIPHQYAEIAITALATSGIDWTQTAEQLLNDLPHVGPAVRNASLAAHSAGQLRGHRSN
ncbi:MAG: hypothetical protein ABW224_13675 [Kibdelosporangium sp.]